MLTASADRLYMANMHLKRCCVVTFLFGALLLLFVLSNAGWAQHSVRQVSKADKNLAAAKDRIDACDLLTGAEVETVQQQPVKEIKPSIQRAGGILISQCLFQTSTFSKSVIVSLAIPDPRGSSALTPREFWKRQFHARQIEKTTRSFRGGKALHESEGDDSEMREPHALPGIGEEAYWVGNQFAGAIYVLQGEVFLRISAGGIREEVARKKKTIALARIALERLPSRTS